MTSTNLSATVLAALRQTVPDVDPATLRTDIALRDQIDMDSMDFLRLLVAVHNATGIDVPEVEYAKMRTIDDIVAFLQNHAVSDPPSLPAP